MHELTDREDDNVLNNYATLTAKTTSLIFDLLKQMQAQIESLTLSVGNLVLESSLVRKMDFHPTKSGVDTDLPTSQNYKRRRQLQHSFLHPEQQLTLQKNQICLTIFPYRGQQMAWRSRHEICKHLSVLLKTGAEYIDIYTAEILTSTYGAQKVLLTFKSSKFPSLLLQQKNRLRQMGIQPVRVFNNSILTPLLPKIADEVVNNSFENTILAATQKDPTNPRCTEPLLAVSPHLENSVEDSLVQSFGCLPSDEQLAITNRLGALRSKFMETTINCHKAQVLQKPDDSNFGSKDTPEVAPTDTEEEQAYTQKSTHQELQKESIHRNSSTLVRNLHHRSKNGCVYEDTMGQLDLITFD